MKRLASLALLALLGCGSKPCPTNKICMLGGFVGDVYVPNMEASISHVTREQWEAAQGLYNGPDGINIWFNSMDDHAALSCNKGYHLHVSPSLICCVPDAHDPPDHPLLAD